MRLSHLFICLAIAAISPISHAEPSSSTLQLIFGEDSGLDPEDRVFASEVWKMVKQFIEHTPSYAYLPKTLAVLFVRADGNPVRRRFGHSIVGHTIEEFDEHGNHRVYLAWDNILITTPSPLLATFELITNKLYRIGFALEHSSSDVATERIRGLTGSLLALNELRNSEIFPELPEDIQDEIKLHTVAYADSAYRSLNSLDSKNHSCALALAAELFRQAYQ